MHKDNNIKRIFSIDTTQSKWERAVEELRKYSNWQDKHIDVALQWWNVFIGFDQNALFVIGNGTYVGEGKEDLEYWFDIFMARNIINQILRFDINYSGLFACAETLERLQPNEAKGYQHWPTLYTSEAGNFKDTRALAYIWMSNQLGIISSHAWVWCGQDSRRFASAQNKVVSQYRQLSRYETGFSPDKQFEQMLFHAMPN